MSEFIVADPADPNSGKMEIHHGVDQLNDCWPGDYFNKLRALVKTIAKPVQVPDPTAYIDWLIFWKLWGELFIFLIVDALIRNLTYGKFVKRHPGIMNYMRIRYGLSAWIDNVEQRFKTSYGEWRKLLPGTGGIFQIKLKNTDKPFQEAIRACFRNLDYSKIPTAFNIKYNELVDQDRFNEDYYENTDDTASDENSTTRTPPPPPPTTTVVHPRTRSNEDRVDDDETNNNSNNGGYTGVSSSSNADTNAMSSRIEDESNLDKNHDDDKSEDTNSSNGSDPDFIFTDEDTDGDDVAPTLVKEGEKAKENEDEDKDGEDGMSEDESPRRETMISTHVVAIVGAGTRPRPRKLHNTNSGSSSNTNDDVQETTMTEPDRMHRTTEDGTGNYENEDGGGGGERGKEEEEEEEDASSHEDDDTTKTTVVERVPVGSIGLLRNRADDDNSNDASPSSNKTTIVATDDGLAIDELVRLKQELSDTKAELNSEKTTRAQVERDLRTQLGHEQVLRKQQLDEFGTFVKDLKTQLSQERELRKQQELRIQDTQNEKMQLQQALRDEKNRRQFDGDEADETQGRLEAELEHSKTLINELVKKSGRSFQRYCIFVATMERNLQVYQDAARGAEATATENLNAERDSSQLNEELNEGGGGGEEEDINDEAVAVVPALVLLPPPLNEGGGGGEEEDINDEAVAVVPALVPLPPPLNERGRGDEEEDINDEAVAVVPALVLLPPPLNEGGGGGEEEDINDETVAVVPPLVPLPPPLNEGGGEEEEDNRDAIQMMDDRDSDDTKLLQKEIKNIHCFFVLIILYVALGLGAVVAVSLYRNRYMAGLTDGSTVKVTTSSSSGPSLFPSWITNWYRTK